MTLNSEKTINSKQKYHAVTFIAVLLRHSDEQKHKSRSFHLESTVSY